MRTCGIAMVAAAGLALGVGSAAAADWFGQYLPLCLGASWTYENFDNPADTYTRSVFGQTVYEGHPAYLYGTPADHNIIARDGYVLTLYAVVDGGVTYDQDEDTVLGEITDGLVFTPCLGGECDDNLVRRWDAIDPVLRSLYDINPAWHDAIVIAAFDAAVAPNLHNTTLASNLPAGATMPPGAVTNLEWYLPRTGLVVEREVDAASGGLGPRYVLVAVSAVPEGGSDDGAVQLAAAVPNPCNPRTRLSFHLEAAATVTLALYDCAGRRVRTLIGAEPWPAGDHGATWAGRDDHGRPLPSGRYLVRLAADGVVRSRAVTLLR